MQAGTSQNNQTATPCQGIFSGFFYLYELDSGNAQIADPDLVGKMLIGVYLEEIKAQSQSTTLTFR